MEVLNDKQEASVVSLKNCGLAARIWQSEIPICFSSVSSDLRGERKGDRPREGEMRCRCWGIRSEMRFSKVTTCISTPLADTLRHQAQALTLHALLYLLEFTAERRRNENGREKESEIECVGSGVRWSTEMRRQNPLSLVQWKLIFHLMFTHFQS